MEEWLQQACDQQADAETRASAVDHVTTSVSNGNMQVDDLVRSMAVQLTSEEGMVRSLGTELLVRAIESAPSTMWNQTMSSALLGFFIDRVDDWNAINPVLEGCDALLRCASLKGVDLDDVQVRELAMALVRRTQIPALSQGSRLLAMRVLHRLINEPYRASVSMLGTDIVEGVLGSVDGERDPRNLLLVFQMLVELYRTRDGDHKHFCEALEAASEEMTDVLSCYFPLSFTPPPGDPHGVTQDELARLLRQAMTCSSCLIPHIVPLVLEKLKSDFTRAKKDALSVLSALASNMPPAAIKAEAMGIWKVLRSELVDSGDVGGVEYQKEVMQTVGDCIRAWWSVQLPGDRILASEILADSIFEDAVSHIRFTVEREVTDMQGDKIVKSAQSLCSALASSSVWCADLVGSRVLLRILPYADQAMPDATREYAFGFVASVVASSKVVAMGACQTPGLTITPPLAKLKSEILACIISGMTSSGRIQELAVAGAVAMITFPEQYCIVPPSLCKVILSQLAEDCMTLQEEDLKEGNPLPLVGILEAGKNDKMQILRDQIVPLLAVNVKEDGVGVQRSRATLTLLMRICSELVDLTELCLQTVQEIFCHCLDERVIAPKKLKLVLQMLETNIFGGELSCEKTRMKLASFIVPKLLALDINECREILADVETCIASAVGVCPVDLQSELIDGSASALISGRTTSFTILCATLCSVSSELDIPRLPELAEILAGTIYCARQDNESECKVQAAIALFSSLVNKAPLAEVETLLSSPAWTQVEHAIGVEHPDNMRPCTMALIWTTKALSMRRHPKATRYTHLILNALDVGLHDLEDCLCAQKASGIFSWLALCTASVGVILKDFKHVLSKNSGAKYSVLYKQAYYVETLPLLLESMSAAPQGSLRRIAYISMVSNLAVFAPHSLVMDNLKMIFPILLESLTCLMSGPLQNDNLILANQLFLSNVLMDSVHNELVQSHVQKLSEALILLLGQSNNVKIREAAVQCLVVLVDHIKYESLYPHHKVVLQALNQAFGDKKRCIRMAAVKAHRVWSVTFSS